ncbi:MAG: 50S ribosomal protein L23 [Candidatus Bilamarchaeaceae archaeon]
MIIHGAVKTEKSIGKIEYGNAITLKVELTASKTDVKTEVEKLFGVKVAGINTWITPKGEKHAMVKVAEGFKAEDIANKLKIV